MAFFKSEKHKDKKKFTGVTSSGLIRWFVIYNYAEISTTDEIVRARIMANHHPAYDFEDRGQRIRHRVGTASRPADSTVACTRYHSAISSSKEKIREESSVNFNFNFNNKLLQV